MESRFFCPGVDTRNLIKVLADIMDMETDGDGEIPPFPPQRYFHEMMMTSDERLEWLYKNRKNRGLGARCPFNATPDVLVFQNISPGNSYIATIALQNIEETPRCLKMYTEPTPYFRFSHPPSVLWTKVAPGMCYQITVTFTPEEERDYKHQIKFFTEKEDFTISIYGFYPRALLDFPDQIRLPDAPVKINLEHHIVVKNFGTVPGAFSMTARSAFAVCPSRAILAPEEMISMKISFETSCTGFNEDYAIVKFEDGVQLRIGLECNAINSNILAPKDSIRFKETFIGLQRYEYFRVENRSSHFCNFKWKMYKSANIEKLRVDFFKEAFDQVRDIETLRNTKLSRMNIIDDEGHALVYARILEDEVQELEEKEEFLFNNGNFKIIPPTGQIGPNCVMEFTTIFSPMSCESLEGWAYLDVTGREDRFALKLYGIGLGPDLKFNIKELQINNIYLCAEYHYEIILANIGHIPGTISYLDNPLQFGGTIKCVPDKIVNLEGGHYAAFVVSFSSTQEGKFVEKLEFLIHESNEKMHFVLTGNVVVPLLTLQEDKIDFGVVPLGYKISKEIILYNKTQVKIPFSIEIAGDGQQRAIDCDTFMLGVEFPRNPRELHFTPDEGIVPNNDSVTGTLTILPNKIREQTLSFVMNLWESNKHCVSVPLHYDCRTAVIECLTTRVEIKFCFINYKYDRKIVFRNLSDLPGHMKYIPIEKNDQSLKVEIVEGNVFIPPKGDVEVTLTIYTPLIGLQEVPLFFEVFGKEPEMLAHVVCDGQGPSVGLIPQNLNFGKVTVLETVTSEIEMLNDTPIPAEVSLIIHSKANSPFSLDTPRVVLEPNSGYRLKVSVRLKDTGKHKERITVRITHGTTLFINLVAFGVGTSINCTPKLEPELALGTLLTHKKFAVTVNLLNEGSRWHKLFFTRNQNIKMTRDPETNSVFRIVPSQIHLASGEHIDIEVAGCVKHPGFASEDNYCHAIIEKTNKKVNILSFLITATFVDPAVRLSHSQMVFHIDVTPDHVISHLRDKIVISNNCGTTLDIDLVLRPPFYILKGESKLSHHSIQLRKWAKYTLHIAFNPPPHKRRCMTFKDQLYINYKDHPKVDQLPVKGIINYPTLSFEPPIVQFGCIPLGSYCHQSVLMKNISPLPVVFKWMWISDTFIEESLELEIPQDIATTSQEPLLHEEQAVSEQLRASTEVSAQPLHSQLHVQSVSRAISFNANLFISAERLVASSEEFEEEDENCLIERRLKQVFQSIVKPYDDQQHSICEEYRQLPKGFVRHKIERCFTVVPHEGCLEPNQTTKCFIWIDPKPHTRINATAFCHVVGGENEEIPIKATCEHISYKLESTVVDFGTCLFYETLDKQLQLTNDGTGVWAFRVSEPKMVQGWVKVEPKSQLVNVGEQSFLTLTCFPCCIERFQTEFYIQIGYLDPFKITVRGFGVYHQIYFLCPRPQLISVNPNLTYPAVADLLDYTGSSVAESQSEYELCDLELKMLEAQGWVIISFRKEEVPSTMDIDMSIERALTACQFITTSSAITRMSGGGRMWPMPNVLVTPYVMDLGCVHIDTRNKFALSYYNYGPGKAHLKTTLSPTFSKRGFEIHFGHQVMQMAQLNELNIAFFPSHDKYPEENTDVFEHLFLDVKNGVRIPIFLKGIVATPTLQVSCTELDFGIVRCGDCLRKSLKLINTGYLEAKWNITIEETSHSKSKANPSFFVLQDEGILQPSESFFLRIYFEPKYDDYLTADFVIHIEGNSRKKTVKAQGEGQEPILEISQDSIYFDPIIPYTADCHRYLAIRNGSKFPVEFFFPDHDPLILEEESLLRCYALKKDITKIYYPYRAPGAKLPPIFESTYKQVLEDMAAERMKFIQSKEGDPKCTLNSKSNSNYTLSLLPSPSPSRKSPRKSKYDVKKWLETDLDEVNAEEKDRHISHFLGRKNFEFGQKDSTLQIDTEKPYCEIKKTGTVLIFHGSPLANHICAANNVGKGLNMPVYTLDRLIVEFVIGNQNCDPVIELIAFIDAHLEAVICAEDEFEQKTGEDCTDVFQRKIAAVLQNRPKKPKPKKGKKPTSPTKSHKSDKSSKKNKSKKSSSKKSDTTSSKQSKKKSKSSKSSKSTSSKGSKGKGKKKKKDTETLINISKDLLSEILALSFASHPSGLIIESLKSEFIRKVDVAFDLLLKSTRDVYLVYFMLFSCSLDSILAIRDEEALQKRKAHDALYKQIYDSIDDLDAKGFEDVRRNYYHIVAEYLVHRKEGTAARKLLFRNRKLGIKIHARKSVDDIDNPELSQRSLKKSEKVAKKKDSGKSDKKGSSKKSSKKSSKSSKKSSSKSSKKSRGSRKQKKRKLTKEEKEIKKIVDTFENTLPEMLHSLEYWDRRNCLLTKSFEKVPKKSQGKKSKNKSGKSSARSAHTVSTVKHTLLASSKEPTSKEDIGIPCWVLTNILSETTEKLMTFFPSLARLTVEAKKEHDKLDEMNFVEDDLLQSVAHKPKLFRALKKSKEFEITNIFDKLESGSGVIEDFSDRKATSKVILPKRKKSAKKSILSLGTLDVHSRHSSKMLLPAEGFTSRRLLRPGEIVKFKISFKPKTSNHFKHVFNIEVVGWPTKYAIKCEGISDIPKIDTTSCFMFEKIIEFRNASNRYEPNVYIENTNTFDFGAVLLPTDVAGVHRDFETSSHIYLSNVSHISCSLTILLQNESNAFTYEPQTANISPKIRNTLTLTAKPSAERTYVDHLLISVKDNPKVERIRLSCFGCPIWVDINPKVVMFERVIPGNVITKEVTVANCTPIEMTWTLVNYYEILEHYNISALSGHLRPFKLNLISIELNVRGKTLEIPPSNFAIEVYDPLDRLVTFAEIFVSAEITDVSFDYHTLIDFGKVKGRKQYKLPFEITNLGIHDVFLKFSAITDVHRERNKVRKNFQIEPLEETLVSLVPFSATVTFSPTTFLDLDNFPIFQCTLIDPFRDIIVRDFEINVSTQSFLSIFEICPFPEIYFGYQGVGTEKVQTFQIFNKGQFEFDYVIKNVNSDRSKKKGKGGKGSKKDSKSSKSKGSKKSKKGSKKSNKDSKKSNKGSKKSKGKSSKGSKKTSKGSKGSKSSKSKSTKTKSSKTKGGSSKGSKTKKRKVKITTLNVGAFTITSSTGFVDPNEAAWIEIKSLPKEAREYEEAIIIHISEPRDEDSKGKILNIHLIACEPKMNFDDVDAIFKEVHIVPKWEDFFIQIAQPHAVYIKSDKRLVFRKVCINTTAIAKIQIRNIGQVPAQVTAILATEKDSHAFIVTPHTKIIEPYQYEQFMIAFTPNNLEEHNAKLTMLCNAVVNHNLVFSICGEACVPEIQIVKPERDEEFFHIHLEPTFLNRTTSASISFRNVGPIPCKAVVEICDDRANQLSIEPSPETEHLINMWEDEGSLNHTNAVSLECGQEAEFWLGFTAREALCYKATVRIHVINNPFDIKQIHVFMEGYYLDVSFDGLPPVARSSSVTSITEEPVFGYGLDFGYTSLNTLVKKCFALRNNSLQYTYKFQFPSFAEVVFSPSVGHLKPKAAKQVVAAFLTKTPVYLNYAKLEVLIYKIQYLEPQTGMLSWDERQHFVTWTKEEWTKDETSASSMDRDQALRSPSPSGSFTSEDRGVLRAKKVEINPEPQSMEISQTWQNIAMFLSVGADFGSYFCEFKELTIPDTFIMNYISPQSQSVLFEVENTGKVPFKIQSWAIITHDNIPRRINSNSEEQEEHVLDENYSTTKSSSSKKSLNRNKSAPLQGNEKFLFGATAPTRPTSSSTLFSSTTLDTTRSGDSWNEFLPLPFLVQPPGALIEAGQLQQFKVIFEPIDVFDYTVNLKANVHNKVPVLKDLEITVKARSILPVYFFEMEPSTYLLDKPKGKKSCNDFLDEKTKVIEFESVGLGVIATKKINLRNPTKEPFFYTWECAKESDPHLSLYHCHTPNGMVPKGKTAEIVFSFIPMDLGTFEEFYFFHIPMHQVNVTFLLVGTAREPRIYFDTLGVELPPTILGIPVNHTICLKNDENEDYSFKFNKLVRTECLNINPAMGEISAKETLPIDITFNPSKRGTLFFDLKCLVEKMINPLKLTISTTTLEVRAMLLYTEKDGTMTELSHVRENVINLGGLIPGNKVELKVQISNIGKVGFKYSWVHNAEQLAGYFDFKFEPNNEILQPEMRVASCVTIVPLVKSSLRQHALMLKIPFGPTYTFTINGSSDRPPYKFSFLEYDFGTVLVQKAVSRYYKTLLQFSNFDRTPITVEKGTHEDFISSTYTCAEIAGKSHKQIPIYFHPFTAGDYKTDIPFFVDGKRISITLIGKAVPLHLEVMDKSDKFIDLGPVLVGKTCVKTVKVMNYTKCPIGVIFDFYNRLPIHDFKEKPDNALSVPPDEPKEVKVKVKGKKPKKETKGKKSKAGSSKASKKSKASAKSKATKKTKKTKGKKSDKTTGTKKSKKDKKKSKTKVAEPVVEEVKVEPKKPMDFIRITPRRFPNVASKRTLTFHIKFSPLERMPAFSEKIFYQAQNYVESFCLLKGSAVSADYTMDRRHLTFGNVVVQFERKLNTQLLNTGDVGLRFNWLVDKNETNFFLSPKKGFIPPGSSQTFDVIFRPKAIKCMIKTIVHCQLVNIGKEVSLTLSGSCISLPPAKENLEFVCPVRSSVKKSIIVENPTTHLWEFMPRITGSYFKAPDIIQIKEKGTQSCDITYSPLRLKENEGILTLPFPDGSVVIYGLKGIPDPPIPEGKLHLEIPCKVPHTQSLTVNNWLQMAQQFHVTTFVNTAPGISNNPKHLYAIYGNSLIDVPASSYRVYEWTVNPITEGLLNLVVKFTNTKTGEYSLYEITIKVLPNKSLDTINFVTCSRYPLTKVIKLQNPVNVPVTFRITCPHESIYAEKSVTVEPHSIYHLEVTYNPRKIEKVMSTLEADCKELGTYCYGLSLVAKPPVPQSVVLIRNLLGQTTSQSITLKQAINESTILDMEGPASVFTTDDFKVGDTSVTIQAEGYRLGRFEGRLIQNATEGEFIYPLICDCLPPKPQGPFIMKLANPQITIPFKNPFKETRIFNVKADPSIFYTKSAGEVSLGAKKTIKITIIKKGKSTPGLTNTGKLTVSCKDLPNIRWHFYLQEEPSTEKETT